MKKANIVIYVMVFLSGGCANHQLERSCKELAGADKWHPVESSEVDGKSAYTEHYRNQNVVWLRSKDGEVAKCISCEGERGIAYLVHNSSGSEESIVLRTCGPY